jgi:glycosyl transferase family 25
MENLQIYVINLDHRKDRLEEITKELDNLKFKRFPAIKTSPGMIGCGLSHLAVLKEARELGLKEVLIFEDDFTFSESKEHCWKTVEEFLKNETYDVVMLAYALNSSKPYKPGLLKVLDAQTASAYIVNNRFYDTLINLFEEAMPLLQSTRKHWLYANDQVWKKLQPGANWFAFEPRMGYQRKSFSDNTQSVTDYHV